MTEPNRTGTPEQQVAPAQPARNAGDNAGAWWFVASVFAIFTVIAFAYIGPVLGAVFAVASTFEGIAAAAFAIKAVEQDIPPKSVVNVANHYHYDTEA